MRGERNAWIQTRTGKQFYPLDPRPEDICIEDIAHALSMLCRYNGHTSKFYSVAEHSVLVSRHVPEQHALAALLHDATEAYLADVPRPVKPSLEGYYDIENKLQRAIFEAFGLSPDMPPEVIAADHRILMDEKAMLMGPEPASWGIDAEPLGAEIIGFSPPWAKEMFLRRYAALTGAVAA